MIELTERPIDSQEVLSRVSSTQAGAVVLFLGTTREFTRGRQTLSLNYECYAEMAEKKLAELSRFYPHAERPLAQLAVIIEGQQILLRQGEGLIEPRAIGGAMSGGSAPAPGSPAGVPSGGNPATPGAGSRSPGSGR